MSKKINAKKNEVHALQFTVSVFVHKLDLILAGRIPGWRRTFGAVNIELADTSEEDNPWFTGYRLRPRGWSKDSHIYITVMLNGKSNWDVCRGAVHYRMPDGKFFDIEFLVDEIFTERPRFNTGALDICGDQFRSAVERAGYYTAWIPPHMS